MAITQVGGHCCTLRREDYITTVTALGHVLTDYYSRVKAEVEEISAGDGSALREATLGCAHTSLLQIAGGGTL